MSNLSAKYFKRFFFILVNFKKAQHAQTYRIVAKIAIKDSKDLKM